MQTPASLEERDDVDVAGSTELERLRVAAAGAPPRGLDPTTYARGHALFEERSDQRTLIGSWLRARLAERDSYEPLAVLSVGCGDGTLDRTLADFTTRDRDRVVRYVGVEPFPGSATRFEEQLRALRRPRLDVAVHVTPFETAPIDETFDLITFVHSMYYVHDVAATLRAAHALLRPGGELLVLSAPRGALNQVVGAIAPAVHGHRQWFSDDVRAAIDLTDLATAERGTLDACVDLSGAGDDVLDFTVQATLTSTLRPLVLAYLAQVSVPGRPMLLPHPVDAYRIMRQA